MAIEFVIETGAGLTNSTSYASEAEYRQYWENLGVDVSAQTTDNVQTYLNRATKFIDTRYRFKGCKYDDDQALQWPRVGTTASKVYDSLNERYVDGNTIPDCLKDAVCEIAYQAASKTQLNPDPENISSKKYGPVSINYSSGGGSNAFSEYRQAAAYIKGILAGGIVRV